MRIALYARVSTKGQDVTMQLAEMREHCHAKKFTIAGEYSDIGISGSKDRRPELDRLMQDARKTRRKFDAVMVWKLDRFGRSLKHLVNTLAELNEMEITFISLRDNLDLSTPSGRMLFHIIGAMAEFERSLTVERVNAGLANARAKGIKLGPKKRHHIAAQVADMRDNQGLSFRDIAAEIGVNVATVHREYMAQKEPAP